MKNEELLISKLIEETCKDDPKEESSGSVLNLSEYFERRVNQVEYLSLKKYLDQQSLNTFKIKFLEKIKCYRVNVNQMKLDFPSNWSLFTRLNSETLIWISKDDDQDFLCDVFTELVENCEAIAVVRDLEDTNLIVFKNEEWKEHVEWFNQYFENKKIKTA